MLGAKFSPNRSLFSAEMILYLLCHILQVVEKVGGQTVLQSNIKDLLFLILCIIHKVRDTFQMFLQTHRRLIVDSSTAAEGLFCVCCVSRGRRSNTPTPRLQAASCGERGEPVSPCRIGPARHRKSVSSLTDPLSLFLLRPDEESLPGATENVGEVLLHAGGGGR